MQDFGSKTDPINSLHWGKIVVVYIKQSDRNTTIQTDLLQYHMSNLLTAMNLQSRQDSKNLHNQN